MIQFFIQGLERGGFGGDKSFVAVVLQDDGE